MIDRFAGTFRFLSNYYFAPIRLTGGYFGGDGISFPTNEHAFAACKTLDTSLRRYIASLPSPGAAKRFGRSVSLRPDWNDVRVQAMSSIVHAKFAQHEDLARLLVLTGDTPLVEGNTWGDTFWGVDASSGVGCNQLGHILMAERAQLAYRFLTPYANRQQHVSAIRESVSEQLQLCV